MNTHVYGDRVLLAELSLLGNFLRVRLRAMVISTVTGVVLALPLSASYGATGAAISTFLLVSLLDSAASWSLCCSRAW